MTTLNKLQTLAVVALVLLTAQGCKTKQRANAAERPANPNQVAITPALENNLKFGTPEMMEVDGTLQVSAHVETDARRIARVGSPVSGRILDLRVFEGQRVSAGTVLAMLHSTDLVGYATGADQSLLAKRPRRGGGKTRRATGGGGSDRPRRAGAAHGGIAAGEY